MACQKRPLSSNLLKMKFMERTRNKLKTDQVDIEDKNERGIFFGDVPSGSVKMEQSRFVFEHRYEILEDLVFGRLSFKGFNPEVEKLMEYFRKLKQGVTEDDNKDVDVNEEQMAQRMAASQSIAKRFQTKRERGAEDNNESVQYEPKRKFIKPNID